MRGSGCRAIGAVQWRADPKPIANARNYVIIFGSILDGDMVIKQSASDGVEVDPNAGNVRMVINPSGNVGFGPSTVLGKLHVDQTSATGAVPVLYLDQADVSEEFIRFDATEATGNAIEDVGAKSLTTTKFIRVNVNGTDLYIQAGTIA